MRSLLHGLTLLAFLQANMPAKAFFGADITYAAIDLYTYSITVQGYSDPLTEQPSIELDLGDGTQVEVFRDNVLDLFFWPCSELRLSTYTTTHTYAAPGTYLLGVPITARPNGILNLPEPSEQPFCVHASLRIDAALGPNSSAQFGSSMTETMRLGNVLHHDPNIAEADGDSLSFQFATPLGQNCLPIGGYLGFDLSGFPNTTVSVDPITGAFAWDRPYAVGQYSIVLRINEWRNGQLIGYVTRDMMLCVTPDYLTNIPASNSPAQLILSPSPGTDELWMAGAFGSTTRIEVHDALGRCILPMQAIMRNRPIQTSTCEPGTYFVSITPCVGSKQVLRWVKQ